MPPSEPSASFEVSGPVRWAFHSPRRLVLVVLVPVAVLAVVLVRPAGGGAPATVVPDPVPAAVTASAAPVTAVESAAAATAPVEDFAAADAPAAAAATARTFLVAWSSASTAPTQEAWLESLRASTGATLLDGLGMTDRALVPNGSVGALTLTTGGGHAAEYVAEVGTSARVRLLVVDEGDRWSVVDVSPVGG